MSFATAGHPPAGINIPNYDDIRQELGFKNVSLGNVLGAKAPGEKITFIKPEDVDLFKKWDAEAFEVQVGLHELLGHGSGKLLQEEPAGIFNFDKQTISPLTGKPITTWYKPGETWGSVFKACAASYEECRAEAVALYLGVQPKVMEIFGIQDHAEDVLYIMYLSMARKGILALEVYDPKSSKWGQAHMQARFALLQIMIQAGIARVEYKEQEQNLVVHVERDLIATKGVEAVGKFLLHLNIFRVQACHCGTQKIILRSFMALPLYG